MGTLAAWVFVAGLMVVFACIVALSRLWIQLTRRANESRASFLAQYAPKDEAE